MLKVKKTQTKSFTNLVDPVKDISPVVEVKKILNDKIQHICSSICFAVLGAISDFSCASSQI